jgi:hypothetical protein
MNQIFNKSKYGKCIPIIFLGLLYSGTSLGSCDLASVRCVGPGEEYNTNVTHVETAFQAAVDSASPGDTVRIRGGVYKHQTSSDRTIFLDVKVSGSVSAPISIEPFEGEHVVIEGFGFPEGTSGPSRSDGVLIRVLGDYIHIRDLELHSSTRFGLQISGNYGLFEELTVHDCWADNVIFGRENVRIEGNVVRYVESYRSRHGSGIHFSLGSNHSRPLSNNRIENSLSYHNGFQPDGRKVPSYAGDPAGGGNSDGVGTQKICHDNAGSAGLVNLCPGTVIRGNIVWHNADDGFDNSVGLGSVIADNISFDNGPGGNMGFKGLRYAKGGVTFIGNVSFSNDARGLEPRMERDAIIAHNLTMHNLSDGLKPGARNSTAATYKVYSNIGAYNGAADISLPGGLDSKANWSVRSDGDPGIPDAASFTANTVRTTFPDSYTVQQKVSAMKQQFRNALTPTADSPLVDAGVVLPDIHCATADDDPNNPMPTTASCRHWAGSAPDIGAFEYGIETSDSGYVAPPSPPRLFKR